MPSRLWNLFSQAFMEPCMPTPDEVLENGCTHHAVPSRVFGRGKRALGLRFFGGGAFSVSVSLPLPNAYYRKISSVLRLPRRITIAMSVMSITTNIFNDCILNVNDINKMIMQFTHKFGFCRPPLRTNRQTFCWNAPGHESA